MLRSWINNDDNTLNMKNVFEIKYIYSHSVILTSNDLFTWMIITLSLFESQLCSDNAIGRERKIQIIVDRKQNN